MQGRVEAQTCIHAAHAVALGGKFGVVPGREAFQLRPADPAGGEGALVAAGLELGSSQRHFRPGGGRRVGVQARGLEGVLVVMKDRRGAVEREAQHLTVGRGVVTGHGGHIGVLVEFQAGIGHDLAHWHDGTLAGHHGGGAHFKHLQDVRRVACSVCGNRCGHGFVVAAFEGGYDFVVLLAGVEVLGQVVDPLAQGATHGVPPLDFGLGLGRKAGQAQGQSGKSQFEFHGNS